MGHGDFNYKLGPTYAQSISKLAVRPSYFTVTDPNFGLVPKPSNHSYDFKYDLRYIREYPGGKENDYWMILINNYGQRT